MIEMVEGGDVAKAEEMTRQRPGVNFTNILRAAFACEYPKKCKKT